MALVINMTQLSALLQRNKW